MQNETKATEQDLQQIADMLLLNGTLSECHGLGHGKTVIYKYGSFKTDFVTLHKIITS